MKPSLRKQSGEKKAIKAEVSYPDMEKGVDTRTLSAEIFGNCGNFWIAENL